MADDRRAACTVDPSGHARHVLEFDKVLAAVAAEARTPGGRERVLDLVPLADVERVRDEHDTVREVRRAIDDGLAPWSFDGVADVRDLLRDAVRPGTRLDPGELRRIAETLETAGRIRRSLDTHPDHWPRLVARTAGLGSHPAVVDAIRAVIDERGELRDNASPALRAIRREQQTQRESLLQRLEGMMRATAATDDPYVTLRGDRYVIPVRSDTAGAVRGIVHDRSASGATLFVEPLEVLDANNELQRLRDAEQREVRRILEELTRTVAADAPRAESSLDALESLDDVQARALWAKEADAHPPRVDSVPSPKTGVRLVLRSARHPLLDAQLRAAGSTCVPLDLDLGGARALVVTGPNTGGKTVALKTVGVLALLSQAGIPIPAAAESELPVFERIVADIGDEQSIEAAVSTFSSHLRHVVDAVRSTGPRTLVLLDELMAGTDPEEGAALARVVLRTLADGGGVTLVTTHLSDLKLFAHSEPGLANAGMAFDAESHVPLYRLQPGVPGSSNAFATAARFGMPDALLAAARHERGDAAGRLEKALASLEAERAQMSLAREQARAAESEAKRIREEYAELYAQVVAKRRTASDDARREAARIVADARARIEQAVRDIRATNANRDSIRAAHDAVRSIEDAARPEIDADGGVAGGGEPSAPGGVETGGPRAPQPGDRVWVRSLAREGILESMDASGRARVLLGNVPFAVPANEVERLGAAPATPSGGAGARGSGHYTAPEVEHTSPRLDLRGMERAEAITAIESFLDRQVLQGSPQVEIVHGKGTGVLRRAVQELLAQHPDVAEFHLGEHNEGGSGATIAKLR